MKSKMSGENEINKRLEKIKSLIKVRPFFIIKHIIADVQCKVANPIISARFHNSIVEMVFRACIMLRNSKRLNEVVLSGGVFQNKFLFKRRLNKLSSQNFNVHFHKKRPATTAEYREDRPLLPVKGISNVFSSSHEIY